MARSKTTVGDERNANDHLRTTFTGGEVILSPGICALSLTNQRTVLERVRRFRNFTSRNDPFGLHDFGSFRLEQGSASFLWKIVRRCKPEIRPTRRNSRRVLTIMLASEY